MLKSIWISFPVTDHSYFLYRCLFLKHVSFFLTGRSALHIKEMVSLPTVSIGNISSNKLFIFGHVLLTSCYVEIYKYIYEVEFINLALGLLGFVLIPHFEILFLIFPSFSSTTL